MKVNWCAAIVAIAVLLPQAARAQVLVQKKPLESVYVMQAKSGEELHGRLLDIGPETLSMIVNNQRLDLPLDDILRIDRRGDSLKNGAAIGASVVAALCAVGCYLSSANAAQVTTALVMNTLLGAAIGASIDAMHSGRTTIYRKSSDSRPRSVGVAFRLRF
jgi:hypothetical protein